MVALECTPLERRLQDGVAAIFQEAQSSTVNHKKNCTSLHNLHVDARSFIEKRLDRRGRETGYDDLIGEEAFRKAFQSSLLRTLSCSKTDANADRIASFIGSYIEYVNERAMEDRQRCLEEGEKVDEEERTYGQRITTRLLKFLLEGFDAYRKEVRYRVLLLLSKIEPHLSELKPNLHKKLRGKLVERLLDKDSGVRALAARCLALIYRTERRVDVPDGELSVQDTLTKLLATEPSSEVRKQIISNLRLNKTTVPHIVKRTRDEDVSVRKLVYGVLKEGSTTFRDDEQMIGHCHPERLCPSDLDAIITNGLRDRESSIEAAAVEVINHWVKIYEEEESYSSEEADPKEQVERGIAALLRPIGLAKCDKAQLAVVERLLKTVFASRDDIVKNIKFPAEYWETPSPERVILARVFFDWCRETDNEQRDTQDDLPAASSVQVCVHNQFNALLARHSSAQDDEKQCNLDEPTFILGELLKVGAQVDYDGDHIGSDSMEPLLREMLLDKRLPEDLLAWSLDVLQTLLAPEGKGFEGFILVVDRVIKELRESVSPEDPTMPISEEMQCTIDEVDSRCLLMCNHLLGRIKSQPMFKPDKTVERICSTLISGNLSKRDNDELSRRALTCKGLWSLIDLRSLTNSVQYGTARMSADPELSAEARILRLHVAFDAILLFMNDDRHFMIAGSKKEIAIYVDGIVKEWLPKEREPKVLTVLCEGLMKLFHLGLLQSCEILITLFTFYLRPDWQDCLQLIQGLTCFFEMYARSSPHCRVTLQKIFVDVFKVSTKIPVQDRIIHSSKLCTQFLKWTDPAIQEVALPSLEKLNQGVQLALAYDILKALFEVNKNPEDRFIKEDKRALYQMLHHIAEPLPDEVDELEISKIKVLAELLCKYHVPSDASSKKALKGFETLFTSKYREMLEGISEEEYEKIREGFSEFHDIYKMESDAEEGIDDAQSRARGKKRSTASTDVDEIAEGGSKVTRRNKRPRLSASSHGARTPPRSPTPLKEESVEPQAVRQPRRSSNMPPPPDADITLISSDSEDELEVPAPKPKTKPRPKKSAPKSISVPSTPTITKQEDDIGTVLSQLRLGPQQASAADIIDLTMDSSDSEEEADEVSGLLEGL